jgi:hypothetical protein
MSELEEFLAHTLQRHALATRGVRDGAHRDVVDRARSVASRISCSYRSRWVAGRWARV